MTVSKCGTLKRMQLLYRVFSGRATNRESFLGSFQNISFEPWQAELLVCQITFRSTLCTLPTWNIAAVWKDRWHTWLFSAVRIWSTVAWDRPGQLRLAPTHPPVTWKPSLVSPQDSPLRWHRWQAEILWSRCSHSYPRRTSERRGRRTRRHFPWGSTCCRSSWSWGSQGGRPGSPAWTPCTTRW